MRSAMTVSTGAIRSVTSEPLTGFRPRATARRSGIERMVMRRDDDRAGGRTGRSAGAGGVRPGLLEADAGGTAPRPRRACRWWSGNRGRGLREFRRTAVHNTNGTRNRLRPTHRDYPKAQERTPALSSKLYSGATFLLCPSCSQYVNRTLCIAREKATKKPAIPSIGSFTKLHQALSSRPTNMTV